MSRIDRALLARTLLMFAPLLYPSHVLGSSIEEAKFKGHEYSQLRETLIQEKWAPLENNDPEGCAVHHDWCATRPEMSSCDIVGPIARCVYVWTRGKDELDIVTLVDGDTVTRILRRLAK